MQQSQYMLAFDINTLIPEQQMHVDTWTKQWYDIGQQNRRNGDARLDHEDPFTDKADGNLIPYTNTSATMFEKLK